MSEGVQSSDTNTLDTVSGEPESPVDGEPADPVERDKATDNLPTNHTEQGTSGDWSFEEKNPFSEFSEEHLNKLDEVLQSEEVRELLKQSTSELDLLDMDLNENQPTTSDDVDPVTDDIPDSIMSVVFSDHGYCINPERASKPKGAGDNSAKPKPVMMTLDEDGNISPMIDLSTSLLAPALTAPDVSEGAASKPESPYVNSPRKSGRAPTRNRMFDEEWVTESPGRGRGRGKAEQGSSPGGGFGKRSSTRISDQKQRDLAEKILQANRQAMEAEKQVESVPNKGRGRGKREVEEVPSPGKGRKGKGGIKGKEKEVMDQDVEDEEEEEKETDKEESEEETQKNKKKGKKKEKPCEVDINVDDDDDNDQDKKTVTKKKKGGKKGKKELEKEESEDDEEHEKETKKKKTGKKGKKEIEKEESEDDEEHEKETKKKKTGKKGKKEIEKEESEDDEETKKKKTGKKGKKELEKEESEDDEETKKKKTGKKGKKELEKEESEDEEETMKKKTGKKGKKELEKEESEDDEETKKKKTGKKGKKELEKEESEDDEEQENATKKKKTGKKGKLALKTKKKEKLKGKKLKKKMATESVEENSDKEKTGDEEQTKASPKGKGLKKLSKKERLKKLKEAKEAKKAKLLEKKKGKNVKLKKKGKDIKIETSDTDSVSPVKKKASGKEDTGSTVTKKKQDSEDDQSSSPVKKKAKLKGGTGTSSPVKKNNASPKGTKKVQAESKKNSPAGANKRKGPEVSETPDSPAKKQKLTKKAQKEKGIKVKSKREISDSEDDTPLKKVKVDTVDESKKSSQLGDSEKTSSSPVRKQNSEMNIFSALSDTVLSTASKVKPEDQESKEIETVDVVGDATVDKKSNPQTLVVEVNTQTLVKAVKDKVGKKNLKPLDSEKSDSLILPKDTEGKVIGKILEASKAGDKKTETSKVADKKTETSKVKGKTLVTSKITRKTLEGGKITRKTLEMAKVKGKLSETDKKLLKGKDTGNKSVDDSGTDKTKDNKESHKRHDSADSKDGRHSHHHHHHHHHHHSSSSRRHSHERRESESSRRDSSSHRRDSNERRHSHDSRKDNEDKKSSHRDRKESSSSSKDKKDRDRHHSRSDKDRSGGRDSGKMERKDSKDRRDSTSSTSNTTPGTKQEHVDKNRPASGFRKVGKDGKVKIKKVKKEEIPMDQSMVDLFKPDNLPETPKEEVSVELTVDKTDMDKGAGDRESKVRFMDETEKKSDIKHNEKKESKDSSGLVLEDAVGNKGSELLDDKEDENKNENLLNEGLGIEKQEHQTEIKSVDGKSETLDPESTDIDIMNVDQSDQNESKSDGSTEVMPVVDVKARDTTGEEDSTAKVEDVSEIKKTEDTESDAKTPELSETVNTDGNVAVKSNNEEVKEDMIITKDAEIVKSDLSDNKSSDLSDNKNTVEEKTQVIEKPATKIRKPFVISDFFKEKRLKINDPKPKKPKVVTPAIQKNIIKEVPVASASQDTPTRQSSRRNKGVAFAEILKKEKLGSDDEEEEEEEEKFQDDENDEDFEDPNKLYCICRQPHNQRFMICCDSCEEWFHGKCVGITRAQGEEMEKNNQDYICPSCVNKEGQVTTTDIQQETPNNATDSAVERTSLFESVTSASAPDSTEGSNSNYKPEVQDDKEISSTVKSPTKQKPVIKSPPSDTKSLGRIQKKKDADLTEKRKRVIKMFKEGDSPRSDKTKVSICVQCNVRPVKPGMRFCSGQCQVKASKDVQKPVGILKVTYSKDSKDSEKKKAKHIAVVEKSTGKTLTGDKAPTEGELKSWLESHPTFEVLKVHKKLTPTKQADEKSSSVHSRSGKGDDTDVSHEGPEPIRLNVRKGLRDALAARADTADDIMLSNSEIKGLALGIEKELYHYFKDTDSKYKAKYRSLVFNIKDVKNKGLFRKILNGRIRPSKLVRMSADELASKELAQWREQETKHTIEMIKQVETELQKEPVQVTKKTHKGEVEVEGEGGVDMSTLVQEPKKEVPKSDEKVDVLADLLPDTTDKHGNHLFDSNCKICTGKVVPGPDSTPSKSSKTVKTEVTPKVEEKDEKTMTKQEKDLQAEEVVKEVLKAIQRAKEESKREEMEAKLGSSVTVRSPDSALSSGLDKKEKFTPSGPMLWKGFIYMQDVSKFVTTAYIITGPSENLTLPDTITVCGRINPEHVWDYLSKVKQAASRDISVVRFIPGTNEEKAAYINLYSYLNSRSRCGVVEHKAKHIKDFYVVPLASHSKIPSVLMPFDGPGLEENRCHMLIGVIIRNKVKSSSSSKSSSGSGHSSRHKKDSKPLKSALKDPVEVAGDTPDKSSSSSTPKTSSSASTPQEKKSTTISFDPIVKEYSHMSEQDEPYTPGGDDPLDLNAPYDPEKEAALKTEEKKEKGKSDAVSLMIEKIALSKNPAEATAAMVTALATTSRLGNQRKLLKELTKKVDEQKRLLEQKRSSKSSTVAGQSPSSSKKSQKEDKKKGLSSKDPRLRAMAASAAKKSESPVEEPIVTEPMDVDMRIRPPNVPLVGNAVVGAPNATPEATPSPAPMPVAGLQGDPGQKSKVPYGASTISSHATAIIDTLTALTNVKNLVSKTDKQETESVVKPTGFYVDKEPEMPEKTKQLSDKSESTEKLSVNIVKQGGENVDSKSLTKVSDSLDQDKQLLTDSVKSDETDKKDSSAIDIVSQLQAEVGGKSKSSDSIEKESKVVSDSVSVTAKTPANDKEGSNVVSQIQAEVQGVKTTKKPEVPNVTTLLKGLGTSAAQGSGSSGQKSLQLPSALMSLFSSLPQKSSSSEAESGNTVLKTEPPVESNSEPQDVDLRETKSGPSIPGFISTFKEVGKSDASDTQKEVKDKVEKDKLSKSFMGFDYDSGSDSDASFEGFEDDGTKVLSPKKRKLLEKGPAKIKISSSLGTRNELGDIDGRTAVVEDVDLRTQSVPNTEPEPLDKDMRTDQPNLDIDQRLGPPKLQPEISQISLPSELPVPPTAPNVLDVDHRRPPFAPQLGLPFVPSGQPPPPGEEWNVSQTVPLPLPPHLTQLPPPIMSQPPNLNPPLPPLPAEPPAPKPPEPPMKKEKKIREGDFENDDKDGKNDGKGKKKELLPSDARLQKIVLEIAKNEPIDPPPLPPTGLRPRSHHNQRHFQRPPLIPTPPMPMSTHGMMPMGPRMPWTEAMGSSGWIPGPPPPGTGLNAQAPMIPPQVAPHMQPGVTFPPHQPTIKPPSLLDMPVMTPPSSASSSQEIPTLVDEKRPEDTKENDVHSEQSPGSEGSQSHSRRGDSRGRDRDDRDRDDRRRRERERDRRSSERDSSDRRSHGRDSRERDRDRSRSDRDRNRDRDRDRYRDRDRDRRSRERDREYDRDRRHSRHRR